MHAKLSFKYMQLKHRSYFFPSEILMNHQKSTASEKKTAAEVVFCLRANQYHRDEMHSNMQVFFFYLFQHHVAFQGVTESNLTTLMGRGNKSTKAVLKR